MSEQIENLENDVYESNIEIMENGLEEIPEDIDHENLEENSIEQIEENIEDGIEELEEIPEDVEKDDLVENENNTEIQEEQLESIEKDAYEELEEIPEDVEKDDLAENENNAEIQEEQLESIEKDSYEELDGVPSEVIEVESKKEFSSLADLKKESCFAQAKESYDKAEEIANHSDLKYYKAHDFDGHIKKVVEKSSECADVLEKTEGVILDRKDIAISALYHDTGMDGGGKYLPTDGAGIRKNHAMQSAIHVLKNREEINKSDSNPDQVAMMCLLHSKSCSGVKDFSDDMQIKAAFDKLEEEVIKYNSNNSDSPIVFNREAFNLEKFKYNAAVLRLGDAFGHDCSESKTQDGGVMDITYDTIKPVKDSEWNENAWQEEVKGSLITYIKDDTRHIINDPNDTNQITRMYHFGEGNISEMGSTIGEDGEYSAYFDVKSGEAPFCTIRCIEERLKEIKSASELFNKKCKIIINLPKINNMKIEKIYKTFASELKEEYGKIEVGVKK